MTKKTTLHEHQHPLLPEHPHPLVGLFFHTLKDGVIGYQGYIRGVDGDHVIAQLYEWIAGEPSKVKVFPKALFYSEDTVTLYHSADAMNYAYDTYSRQRERDEREAARRGAAALEPQ